MGVVHLIRFQEKSFFPCVWERMGVIHLILLQEKEELASQLKNYVFLVLASQLENYVPRSSRTVFLVLAP